MIYPRSLVQWSVAAAASLIVLALGRGAAAVIVRAAERAGEEVLFEGYPDD